MHEQTCTKKHVKPYLLLQVIENKYINNTAMSNSNTTRREKNLAYFRTRPDYYDKKEDRYLCFCGGEYCKGKLTKDEVRVEHRNNDNTDDSHRNIRPASHSCNIRIGFIQRKRYRQNDQRKRIGESEQQRVTRIAMPIFRKWVVDWVRLNEIVTRKELIDGGSNHIVEMDMGITFSQSTAERYLDQLCSVTGPLFCTGYKDDDVVELRDKRLTGPS